MSARPAREEGTILIAVLVLTLILSITFAAIANLAFPGTRQVRTQVYVDDQRAANAAEIGLQVAIEQLRTSVPAGRCATLTLPNADGLIPAVTVVISCTATGGTWQLTAVDYVLNPTCPDTSEPTSVRRTLSADVQISGPDAAIIESYNVLNTTACVALPRA